MTEKYNLERFLPKQDEMYDIALREIQNGRKESHWIWFIFPQLRGLGHSLYAKYFGIDGPEEARQYLEHPTLRARLEEISAALLALDTDNAPAVMGYPDYLKLQSSMTLFALISEPGSVYARVLDKFYGGARDAATLRLLKEQAP